MFQHQPKRIDTPLLLAFCASAVVGLAAQWPGLANPYVVNDDVRQQLFWMQRWLDPALYPPDILNAYASLYVSWGVKALYRAGCLALDPLFFSKLVAAGLFAWLSALFFATGRALRDGFLGLIALALCWFSPAFMENISGGLARGFAAPLLLLFILALLQRRRVLALAALFAQALFIPYILLPCLLAAALHLAAWRLRLVRTPPVLRGLADTLACVVALSLAVAWQHGIDAAGFGPLPWASEVANRPEFYAGGRLDLLPPPSIAWEFFARPWAAFAPFREGLIPGIAFTCLALPLLALGARRADWKILAPQAAPLCAVLAASLALYAVARLVAFKLFVPSRYLEYTTNLFLCLGTAFLLDALLRPRLTRSPRPLAAVLLGCALAVGMLRQYGVELYDFSGDVALYAFARSTPKDTRFAGPPDIMDTVLTFGQRNVYASFELAHPWSAGYWAIIGPRLERLADAAYAADPETLRRFCREEHIHFFVVDRRQYTPQFIAKGAFFEPYSTRIRQLAARAAQDHGFAALSGRFPTVRIDADTSVLDMRPQARESRP
ncbi:MAG: hypothetical protein P4L39_01440 [Humidesulfovibrio sp.]|nr:hypothetical protein [Humidesulfovibrio sp.]